MKIRGQKPGKGKFRPTESNTPPPESDHPSISLRYTKPSHCLSRCAPEDRVAFADKILSLTKMTWAQINTSPRHGLGYERIDQLKGGLPIEAGESPAIAFRFSGLKPMVGFRRGGVLNIVWFDRDFNLYNHG